MCDLFGRSHYQTLQEYRNNHGQSDVSTVEYHKNLVADFYFSLAFFSENSNRNYVALLSLFKPISALSQLTEHEFTLIFLLISVLASVVTFDGKINDIVVNLSGGSVADKTGLSQEISIPHDQHDIFVQLVHSTESTS